MGDGTKEGLAVDKRISSIFVSEGKQNTQKWEEQENVNKALGYTSYGKYVGFLYYPVDGSNQLLRNLDPYSPIYIVSHQRSWIQVHKTLKLILEIRHAEWKENKIINFCFRGNKLQLSNYGVHEP